MLTYVSAYTSCGTSLEQDARPPALQFTGSRLGLAVLGQPHPDRRRPRGGRRGADRATHGDRRVPVRVAEERVR